MSTHSIDGTWWIHGADRPAQFGTLQIETDRLQLTVKIPEGLSFAQSVDLGVENDEEASVPERILGQDANNKPVTLFGCFALRGSSAGLTTYKIRVLAAVQGLEFDSWSQKSIRAASFQVDLLHRWLGSKIMEHLRMPDRKETWTVAMEDDLLFDVTEGVRLRIVRFVAPSWSLDEYKWAGRPRIWIHFDEPQSLYELTSNWVPWVTRFFSLVIGDSTDYDDLECYVEDPYTEGSGYPTEGKLFGRGRKREPKDVDIHSMFAPYPEIADSMPQLIKTWHEVASRLEAVVDLFSIVTFHQSLHCAAKFLFLVQALEVYHARSFESTALPTEQHKVRVEAIAAAAPLEFRDWARLKLQGANFKHLDERIREVLERHAAEAQRIFKNLPELAEKVRYTRNYLTHYTGSTNSQKYLKNPEMVEVNWGLRTLLWACLLKEIGISGRPIERLIHRNINVHFVNLV